MLNVAILIITWKNFYALVGIMILTSGKCDIIYRLCNRPHSKVIAPASARLTTKFPTMTVCVTSVKSLLSCMKTFVNSVFTIILGINISSVMFYGILERVSLEKKYFGFFTSTTRLSLLRPADIYSGFLNSI